MYETKMKCNRGCSPPPPPQVLLDIIDELGWADFAVIAGPGQDEHDHIRDLYRDAGSRGKCIASHLAVDVMVSTFPKILQQLEHLFKQGEFIDTSQGIAAISVIER